MKKLIIFALLGVFLLFLGLRVRTAVTEKAAARLQKPPVVVKEVETARPIERQVVETVDAWGTASVDNSLTIYSNQPGKLLNQRYDRDAVVAIGDTLARVDRNSEPLDYADSWVTCSKGGVITKRFLDDGAVITPQTALYTIQDLTDLVVSVPVAQGEIGKVKPNANARITCDAYPDEEFAGQVVRIAPISDPANHTTVVELSLHSSKIRSGMLLKTEIAVGTRSGMFVPDFGIVKENGQAKALVVRNSLIRKVPIEAAGRWGDLREVTAGLTRNDELVSSGSAALNDGDSVVVKPRGVNR